MPHGLHRPATASPASQKMRPKSALAKVEGNTKKHKRVGFSIKPTDRQLTRSTSRFQAFTEFTPARQAREAFEQLSSRGTFLSYNSTIKSVQSYSKTVGEKIDHEIRSRPPKIGAPPATDETSGVHLSSRPKQRQKPKTKTLDKNGVDLFRSSVLDAHNKRVHERLKEYYEYGVTETIRQRDKEKTKIEKMEQEILSIKAKSLKAAQQLAKKHREEMEKEKQQVDTQARKEMHHAIVHEREWMKDELEHMAKDHEAKVKELRQEIVDLKKMVLREKAHTIEVRTDLEQDIFSLQATHASTMDAKQQELQAERKKTKDAMIALSDLMAQSASEKACTNMVAKEHQTMMVAMRQKLDKTIENSTTSNQELVHRLETEEALTQKLRHAAVEQKLAMEREHEEQIDTLERQHKKDIKDIIAASADREARSVQRAIHNAQRDLSKILIGNAEKIKGRLVLRHKTIVATLTGRLETAQNALKKEQEDRVAERAHMQASHILDHIIACAHVVVEKKLMMERHTEAIASKDTEIKEHLEDIASKIRAIEQEQESKQKMEDECKATLLSMEQARDRAILALKDDHAFDKKVALERAKEQRERIVARMTEQRKEIELKHAEQKEEILAAFRAALEATSVGGLDANSKHLSDSSIGSVDDQISMLTNQLTNRHARERACVLIQKFVRRWLARLAYKSLRRRLEDKLYQEFVKEYSATKIQSLWRKFSTYHLFKNLRWAATKHKRNEACRAIQRSWHRKKARLDEANHAVLEPPKEVVIPKAQLRYRAREMLNAIKNNEFDFISRCIAMDPTVVHRRDELSGLSPMHVVNTRKMGDLLKSAGADLNARDVDGRTPLISAIAENKKMTFIHWLVSNGANVSLLTATSEYCGPNAAAMHVAASMGWAEAVQLLVSAGADTNARDGSGWTPLFYAVARVLPSSVDVVKCLLEGNSRVNITDSEGVNPLLLAIMQNNDQCAHQLLHAHANPNGYSKRHGSPIYQCVLHGVPGTLRQLLAYGGVPSFVDEQGAMALHVAARLGRVECLEMLLEASPNVTMVDYKGNTPLHDAIYHKRMKIVKILLKFQNNFMHRNKDGLTVFDIADRLGHQRIAHLLSNQEGTMYEDSDDRETDKIESDSNDGIGVDEEVSDTYYDSDSNADVAERAMIANKMAVTDPFVPYYDSPEIDFWEEHFDEAAGRNYWYNRMTDESTWDMPLALQEVHERNIAIQKAKAAAMNDQEVKPSGAVQSARENINRVEDWTTYRL